MMTFLYWFTLFEFQYHPLFISKENIYSCGSLINSAVHWLLNLLIEEGFLDCLKEGCWRMVFTFAWCIILPVNSRLVEIISIGISLHFLFVDISLITLFTLALLSLVLFGEWHTHPISTVSSFYSCILNHTDSSTLSLLAMLPGNTSNGFLVYTHTYVLQACPSVFVWHW